MSFREIFINHGTEVLQNVPGESERRDADRRHGVYYRVCRAPDEFWGAQKKRIILSSEVAINFVTEKLARATS